MRWLMTHGISMFVATFVFFVALAIAAWIWIGFGAALIVAVATAIWVAVALPPLVQYYDDANNPASGRHPDALR
jgi:type IV secretory pathway TrbD component